MTVKKQNKTFISKKQKEFSAFLGIKKQTTSCPQLLRLKIRIVIFLLVRLINKTVIKSNTGSPKAPNFHFLPPPYRAVRLSCEHWAQKYKPKTPPAKRCQ